ncbi:MAG: hypothetical protein II008_06105 [Oscillospiraceae bacterium]|nr:hypothetical protein [Oscillospiraceae bacterium]
MTNKIIIGSETYTDELIRLDSINGINTSSLVGDQLEIDQLKFRVTWADKSDLYEVYQTRSGAILEGSDHKVYRLATRVMPNLTLVPYATEVRYYQNEALRAKMYFDHADRVTATDFEVTCVSAIGILDKQTHNGGLYTGQTVRAVITDIINGVLPWGISSALGNAKVYGWLPIETKREALHQILFAFGANIRKNGAGDMYFDYLNQTAVKTIPPGRLFAGGKSKYTPPTNRVEVTEHTFFTSANDETITLFDNTGAGGTPAGNTFIAFSEAPCYDLAASPGLSIDSYDVNWAVISGTGILTGKRFSHQTGIAVRENNQLTAQRKNVSSSKCTLVSMLTSPNVTRRLLSYYGSAQTFSIDIERTNEIVGDQVQFVNPFGETVTGFLGSMNWKCTSFERAKADVVMNYEPTPPGGGSGFSNVAVISSNGSWIVPANVTEIHVILIGGGQGGQGGYNGEAGTAGTGVTSNPGSTVTGAAGVGGEGGEAGVGGHGGLIFNAIYEVTPSTSLSITVGAGGTGGAVGGNYGAEGGNTTLSGGGISASSENGYLPTNGFYDVLNQVLYAAEGNTGVAGGKGGNGGNPNNTTGNLGENAGSKAGGSAGTVVNSSASHRTWLTPDPESYTQTRTIYGFGEWPVVVEGYRLAQADTLPDWAYVNPSTGNWLVQDGHTYRTDIEARHEGTNWVTALNFSGQTLTIEWYEREWYYPFGPEDYNVYKVTRTYKSYQSALITDWSASQFAGGGGGASVSANGGNASNNNAGNGANATIPIAPTVYGSGGHGGHGGGGGGGGGGATITTNAQYSGSAITKAGGTAGAGGSGTAGTNGVAGCVLIYY